MDSFLFFNWLGFQIHLDSLDLYLKENIHLYDGIVANSDGFNVIIKRESTQPDIDVVNSYLITLSENDELLKRDRKEQVLIKIKNFLELLSGSDINSLSEIHPIGRKIIYRSELTKDEEDYILGDNDLFQDQQNSDVDNSSTIMFNPEGSYLSSNNVQDALVEIGESIIKNTTQNIMFQFVGQLNSDQYLLSGAHIITSTDTRRSGNESNGYQYSNSAPSVSTHTGKVISATATIRGIANSTGSPNQNIQLLFELWKVGFAGQGTKLGNVIFNINTSQYNIGLWWNSSVSTNFAENQSQDINVIGGDILALKYIRQEGADKVVAIENTTIVLEIQRESL